MVNVSFNILCISQGNIYIYSNVIFCGFQGTFTCNKPYPFSKSEKVLFWICDHNTHLNVHTMDKSYQCTDSDIAYSIIKSLKIKQSYQFA